MSARYLLGYSEIIEDGDVFESGSPVPDAWVGARVGKGDKVYRPVTGEGFQESPLMQACDAAKGEKG